MPCDVSRLSDCMTSCIMQTCLASSLLSFQGHCAIAPATQSHRRANTGIGFSELYFIARRGLSGLARASI